MFVTTEKKYVQYTQSNILPTSKTEKYIDASDVEPLIIILDSCPVIRICLLMNIMKAIYTIRFKKLGVFIFNINIIVMFGVLRQFIVLYFVLVSFGFY